MLILKWSPGAGFVFSNDWCFKTFSEKKISAIKASFVHHGSAFNSTLNIWYDEYITRLLWHENKPEVDNKSGVKLNW